MPYLYKITNLHNNKCYIGWTGTTVQARWGRHQKDAIRGRDNRKFYNAIRKYGIECWSVETLMEVSSVAEAKLQEINLIAQNNSYNRGYNATKGGDGNNGIVMSPESNEARRRALAGIPKTYDRMKGKRHSKESRDRIASAHKGMKKPWVKPTRDQIVKRAMARRSLTKEQYDQMHLLRSTGMTIGTIADQIQSNSDLVKKWLKKEWIL